ncbi:class I SAM-dependent methyltransferase [uncultured Oscillibacter sp.]|uniref:class I SAM-dependent DNA methyltransferase n=1 Tax=uncultured Oscillibacter sp. TaxID=876091 RepID=UPI00280B097B|nr:class I SAM-dependent methyltransferase [uncultured Oscillibacter sp.]
MSSYEALAASYDGLMADASYCRRAAFLDRLLKKSAIPVHSVLDLACGTGTISCLLAQQGYQVIATDGSEEMLTQAMGKAVALGEGMPLFLQQDMTRLRLAEPVDAAVSTLDSLNYLTREKDVRETFHRVWRWLRPGGQFIFDVNTPYKLQRMDGQIYMDETEETCCVWRTFFSQRTQVCTYQVDLFQLRPDGAWERTFEEHRERAWSRAQFCAWLEEAGFEKITVTGDLSLRSPREDADRWIIRARKPLAKEEK